jgi:tetratricopeptide (TPR) repeat protein
MAPEAIRVLETYCADSPLDTSNILFDAYQRLADWNGCLRVLRQSLLTVDEDFGRATLHYKIAALLDQLGDQDGALDNYAKATRLAPPFYDAIEGIVTIAVARKDWKMVLDWFKVLEERVVDDRLRAQLRQATKRLADGMARGAGG